MSGACVGCEHCGCNPADQQDACYACEECEPSGCTHPAVIEDADGNHLCARCDYEWWEDPL